MDENFPEFYSIEQLRVFTERGVKIPDLSSVKIAKEIKPQKILPGSIIYPFARIMGLKTQILSGAKIGVFGPTTLQDSWIGENTVVGNLGPVTLNSVVVGPGSILGSGVAEKSVFLGKESSKNEFSTGYGFRIRNGSLYEEDASSAQHTDTKMTILFPWATLGSNINFCDALLAGGTGSDMGFFSEVGSGTIHFNFSIRGDKPTASLFGDVTHGVFLDKERLFIGGNNSLIGPIKAEFGAMTSAEARIKGSISSGLNFGESLSSGKINYDPKIFFGVLEIVKKQINVISELVALFNWYKQIRISCVAQSDQKKFLYDSGMKIVEKNFQERLLQLNLYIDRVENSQKLISNSGKITKKEIAEQKSLLENWSKIQKRLKKLTDFEIPAPLLLKNNIRELQAEGTLDYTKIIKKLSREGKESGEKWLSLISKNVRKNFFFEK